MYISANKKTCTSSCDDGFTGDFNSDGKRVCVCADSKFYDAGKDACVVEDACEGYTYVLDGNFRQCIDEELCFELRGYAMDKDGKRQCIEKCP